MPEYNLPYFPFHIEQWSTSYQAQSLHRETRLTFYDLLAYLWRCEGMAPNNDAEIAFHLRITQEQWLTAKKELIQAELIFVIQADRKLHNPLLRLEWERVADICAANHAKAAKAAKTKWEKQRKINT